MRPTVLKYSGCFRQKKAMAEAYRWRMAIFSLTMLKCGAWILPEIMSTGRSKYAKSWLERLQKVMAKAAECLLRPARPAAWAEF